jgi:NitT/TauT family transport system permease protein
MHRQLLEKVSDSAWRRHYLSLTDFEYVEMDREMPETKQPSRELLIPRSRLRAFLGSLARSRSFRDEMISLGCGIVTLGVCLSAWEFGASKGWPVLRFFPPPSQFLRGLVDSDFRVGLGAQSATILQSVTSSVLRVFAGLSIGFASAIVVGCLVCSSIWVKRFLFPIVQILAPIAPVAWIPLGLVVFGIGNQTAVFIVVMGVFFTLTIATIQSIESVPEHLIESARSLGCRRFQILAFVVLPYILPSVFTILRLNFIAAWMAVLAAEMTGLGDGLGAIVMIGRNLFNNKLILLGMCLIGVSGFIVDFVLAAVQRTFFWWGGK